jgi:hypothetical protein
MDYGDLYLLVGLIITVISTPITAALIYVECDDIIPAFILSFVIGLLSFFVWPLYILCILGIGFVKITERRY